MLLQELSEAIGVSGNEDEVRKIVLDAIEGHVEDIRIDSIGNITSLKKGTEENRLRVMLTAHMDEIGFMVTAIDSNGLIQFTKVGSVDDRILPGLRVKVGDKQISGVIIWTPIHMNRDQKVVTIDNLRIDIGANKKDGVNVKLGERIAFDSTYRELGDTMLRGKAFDNRVGCSILIDILQGGPYPVDILVAFTVQEEIGTRGAKVAAHYLQPDVAFVLEGTTANDVPNPNADPDENITYNPTTRLGFGAALTVMDRSMIVDPRLLDFLKDTASSNNIPYQLKTRVTGGTDGGKIHLSTAGVPSAVISVPCRYIHSPHAILHKSDYNAVADLVRAALNNITDGVLKHE